MPNCGYVALKGVGHWCHEMIEWGDCIYFRKSENIPEEVSASWDLKFQRTLNLHRSVSVCVHAQSCLTLCKPLDCSPPASSVHGIFQARILEWFAIPFSRGFSWPRNRTRITCIVGRFFTVEPLGSPSTQERAELLQAEKAYTQCIHSGPLMGGEMVPGRLEHRQRPGLAHPDKTLELQQGQG